MLVKCAVCGRSFEQPELLIDPFEAARKGRSYLSIMQQIVAENCCCRACAQEAWDMIMECYNEWRLLPTVTKKE